MFFIPPGGFAGFSQQTMATKALLSPRSATGRRKTGTRKKRPTKKRARPARRKATSVRRRRAKAGRPARLVKGSAAAKRYMAKIRKMRKR